MSRITVVDGCWEWGAGKQSRGYGMCWNGEKAVLAHRFSFEVHKGEIPEGLVIDHLCRNRSCVNPDHLEAVSQRENVRRGNSPRLRAAQTHCKRGHEYTPENTHSWGGSRACKSCKAQLARERIAQGRGR